MNHNRITSRIMGRGDSRRVAATASRALLPSLSIWLAVALAPDCVSAWDQGMKFFLGAADGPCLSQFGGAVNVSRMAALQDLALDYGTVDPGQSDYDYLFLNNPAFRLGVVRDAGPSMLTVVPAGHRRSWWKFGWNLATADSVLNQVSPTMIDAGSRNALLGYWVADEPKRWPTTDPQTVLERTFVKEWIHQVKTKDSSKLAFLLLTPIGPLEDASGYSTALDTWFDDPDPTRRADVIAFDHYPFTSPEDCWSPGYSRKYFLNISLARAEAAGRPVWVVVQTQAYGYDQYESSPGVCDPNCPGPNCTHPTPIPRTVPQPSSSQLRFQIYCPLAYGVKGLFYWNYSAAPAHAPNPPIPNPRLITDCSGTQGPLYAEAQHNNRFIANMLGPVIMGCNLFGTYHQSVYPDGEQLNSGELLSSTTPVLTSMLTEGVAGLYTDPTNTALQYLLVVNKETLFGNQKQLLVTLKGNYTGLVYVAPRPSSYTPGQDWELAAANWNSNTNTTTVSNVLASGGEARLFKLLKDGIPPGTSSLSYTKQCLTVKLLWTAPHDDGPYGGACSTYEIRRSSQPLTDANFASGTLAASGSCGTPGSAQNTIIDACTAQLYYAIRFADEAGNVSYVSNNTPPIAGTCAGQSQCLPPKAGVGSSPLTLALDATGSSPVSTSATFELAIPDERRGAAYRIEVFDLAGRRVRALEHGLADPGRHTVTWNLRDDQGESVANGVYIARLSFENDRLVRRVIVVR